MFSEIEVFKLGQHSITAGNVVVIAILIAISFGLNRLIYFYATRYAKRNKKKDGRLKSVVQLISYFIWILTITFALRSTGIKVAYLLGGSAAVLVGLGIGLQDIFRDVVSGIIMLFEGKINMGDVLEVEGAIGKVSSLGLRTTELIARDGEKVIVPNNKLISEHVINRSHSQGPARQSVKVIVDFNSDVTAVVDVLYRCLNELNGSHKDGEHQPSVRLIDFASNGYQFEMLFFTFEYFRFENIKSDLRFIVSKKFKENKIIMPASGTVTIISDTAALNRSGRDLE